MMMSKNSLVVIVAVIALAGQGAEAGFKLGRPAPILLPTNMNLPEDTMGSSPATGGLELTSPNQCAADATSQDGCGAGVPSLQDLAKDEEAGELVNEILGSIPLESESPRRSLFDRILGRRTEAAPEAKEEELAATTQPRRSIFERMLGRSSEPEAPETEEKVPTMADVLGGVARKRRNLIEKILVDGVAKEAAFLLPAEGLATTTKRRSLLSMGTSFSRGGATSESEEEEGSGAPPTAGNLMKRPKGHDEL